MVIPIFLHTGKLVGMTTDGASNMMGHKNGLAKLVKDSKPELISIHCLCHRLELALRDTFKGSATKHLYDKLMTLMIGLYYFYRKSHKQQMGLKDAMEMLKLQGTFPPKVTGTRWISYVMGGIQSLRRTYRAYEAHLSTSSHSNAKAEGLFKLLTNKELVAFMLFLQVK